MLKFYQNNKSRKLFKYEVGDDGTIQIYANEVIGEQDEATIKTGLHLNVNGCSVIPLSTTVGILRIYIDEYKELTLVVNSSYEIEVGDPICVVIIAKIEEIKRVNSMKDL